jgi:hypothetical protein
MLSPFLPLALISVQNGEKIRALEELGQIFQLDI